LAAMSALLDEQPALGTLVQQDLEAGCPTNARTGRPGLSGEQTLRLLVVRQLTGWTYAELAFHLADSMTYRAFSRVSALVATPLKSALAATFRRVSPGAHGCDYGTCDDSSTDGFESVTRCRACT
jgi:IS5 family transposase